MSQTVDDLFAKASEGDSIAFASWMGTIERAVRVSLIRYARAVDVESILQETFMRMWIVAKERSDKLVGENASLKYAIGMARNLAQSEARRFKRVMYLPPEEVPDVPVESPAPLDGALNRAIAECVEKLSGKPRFAMHARLRDVGLSEDRFLALRVKMTKNTFLQNIVRARNQVRSCLEKRGVRLSEILA